MKSLSPTYKRLSASWLPEVGILWLFLLSRLWNNLALPAYVDEGSMIIRARYIERGRFVFAPLYHNGKWLQPAAMSLLAPDGPETLWLARIASALLVMFSCAACIGLGRMFASRGVGRLAGAFYLLPALGFIHERSAVSDVWMAAFSSLALALAARLALSRKASLVLPLGLAMAAAVLSKVSGASVLVVPLAAALILPPSKKARRRATVHAVAAVALAVVIVLALVAVAQAHKMVGEAPGKSGLLRIDSVCKHSPLCEAATSPRGLSVLAASLLSNASNARIYARWVWFLVGPPMLALSLLALTRLGGEGGRGAVCLWVALLARGLSIVVIGNWLPIRNFLILVPGLAVLAALGVSALWRLSLRAAPRVRLLPPAGGALLLALVVGAALSAALWSAPLDLAFASQPQTVVVPPLNPYSCLDRHHYSFAYGYPEVSQTLRDWMERDPRRLNVVAETERHMLSYWGPRVGDIEQWREGGDALRVRVALWLAQGESVFFVDELPARPIPDEPFGARLETVAVHPIPCGDVSLRVRRLVEDSPELRRSIYEAIFPSPDEVADQYRAIAIHLIDSQAEGAVVVYPPNQFELLDSRLQWGTALDGVYVVGDMWPLDVQQVQESLARLAAEHGQLHVVLLAEELGDPTHAIENWLNAHMQLVSEMWFGPVRLLSYEAGA